MSKQPPTARARSLVHALAPGQSAHIDCNVLANPAQSVHYSWFAAPAGAPQAANLSEWMARDAALDEQCDESR